jgi:hypothetical protein
MAVMNSASSGVLVEYIGQPGTPLRRIKDKAIRTQARHRLQELSAVMSSDQQLRVALALGKTPDSKLLSAEIIQKALSAEDCTRLLPQLVSSRVLLHAKGSLSAITVAVRERRNANILQVVQSIAKATTQWTKRSDQQLDEDSTCAYGELLETLLVRARHFSFKTRKSEVKFARLLATSINFLLKECLVSNRFEARWAGVKVLLAVQDATNINLENELERDPRPQYDRLVSLVLDDLSHAATRARAEHFAKSVRALLRLRIAKSQTLEFLQKLWIDRGGFRTNIQLALAELLEVSPDLLPEIAWEAGPAPNLEHVQLASSLIRAWFAKTDSPRAQEAYDELSSVLKSFFGIAIKGEPGEIAPFDPRLHEFAEGRSVAVERVKIFRPRVEREEGATVVILIKALVVPE